jgi:hypothetical protein
MFWEFEEGEGQKEKENKCDGDERLLGIGKKTGGEMVGEYKLKWREVERKERRHISQPKKSSKTFFHFYDQMCKGHMRRIEL